MVTHTINRVTIHEGDCLRLTAISPKLDWKQTPGGACITGDIQLTFEVGAMGPGTLEELKEWLRRRKQ